MESSGSRSEQEPQPLSDIARCAYGEFGVLSRSKLQGMLDQRYITPEDAAALPNAITPDGRPDTRTGISEHERPRLSQSAPRPATVTPPAVTPTLPVTPATPVASSSSHSDISAVTPAPPVASSSSHSDISAVTPAPRVASSSYRSTVPSDYVRWTEDKINLLIELRAKGVEFTKMAYRFPGKNQNAARHKFNNCIRDETNPRWKERYEKLRAQHDSTVDDPVDEDTVVQPAEKSSEAIIENDTEDPNASN